MHLYRSTRLTNERLPSHFEIGWDFLASHALVRNSEKISESDCLPLQRAMALILLRWFGFLFLSTGRDRCDSRRAAGRDEGKVLLGGDRLGLDASSRHGAHVSVSRGGCLLRLSGCHSRTSRKYETFYTKNIAISPPRCILSLLLLVFLTVCILSTRVRSLLFYTIMGLNIINLS